MAKYSLSKKALDDLSTIWEYTYEVWSEFQAEKYYYMLLDTCQDMADGNFSGKSYSKIGNEVLGFKADDTSYSTEKLRAVELKLQEFYMSEWI